MKNFFLVFVVLISASARANPEPGKATSFYLIGNSLTWDTVPGRLDGDTQWHVDCGKSLPFIFQNPEKPCVKSSTLWPTALSRKQYDIISIQVHYGSTLTEDAVAISELMTKQPDAIVVIHTGWARHAERAGEWAMTDGSADAPMKHHLAYFDALLEFLRKAHPERTIWRTRAMDLLQRVAEDIEAGEAPIDDVADLHRDKVHMDLVTGRYLMHNAMRHALGQPRSVAGFEKLEPEMKAYLDSVLDRVLKEESAD